MSVKGLHSLINRHYPAIKKKVSIGDMAESYREKNGIKDDVIMLVSGTAIVFDLYKDINWVCGGQWREYIERIKQFVESFEQNKIRLIFVFDGKARKKGEIKRKKWERDRRSGLIMNEQIFVKIKTTNDGEEVNFTDDEIKLPFYLYSMTASILKDICSCQIYESIDGCNREIARIANALPNCFAIISKDTDFIIYDTKSYITIEGLDYSDGKLNGTFIDRDAFCQQLGIKRTQLALLASLMGNKLTEQNLKSWHRKMIGSNNQNSRNIVLLEISKLIKRKEWISDYRDSSLVNEIVKQMTNRDDENIEAMTKLIHDSLKNYMVDEEGISIVLSAINGTLEEDLNEYVTCLSQRMMDLRWPIDVIKETVLNGIRESNTVYVTKLILTGEFDLIELLEDSDEESLPSSKRVYENLQNRCYQVLFNRYLLEGKEFSLKETIVCCEKGVETRMIDQSILKPVTVAGLELPTLEELWFTEGETFRSKKLQAFLYCLGDEFQSDLFRDQLLALPTKLIFPTLVLKYLRSNQEIKLDEDDIEALIAQALLVDSTSLGFLKKLRETSIDTRIIHLTSILMKGIVHLLFANSICGKPFADQDIMPWNYFDGKLFHHYCFLAKDVMSIDKILADNEPLMRIYNTVRSLI